MRPSSIVKLEVVANLQFCLAGGFISMKINMLILDGSAESLDKYIIPPSAFAIHADSNPVVCEEFGKSQAGELAALIGVHDHRFTVFFDRFFERVQAKTGVHRD